MPYKATSFRMEMMSPSISSSGHLRDILQSFQNEVVCCLCESSEDLKLMGDELMQLGTEYTLYYPFPPCRQRYKVIIDFVKKVESEKKGELINFIVVFAFAGILLTLRVLFENLKADHIIYLPGPETISSTPIYELQRLTIGSLSIMERNGLLSLKFRF